MNTVLILSLLPAVAMSHGCPKFNISTPEIRDIFLEEDIKTFPQSAKDRVMNYDNDVILTGIFDCHVSDGEHEVGVTAVCDPNGDCECTALYNFNECASCSLDCGADPLELNIRSFSADCSNVKGEGLTDNCMAMCDYTSEGCMNLTAVELELMKLERGDYVPRDGGDGMAATTPAPVDAAPSPATVGTTAAPPESGNEGGERIINSTGVVVLIGIAMFCVTAMVLGGAYFRCKTTSTTMAGNSSHPSNTPNHPSRRSAIGELVTSARPAVIRTDHPSIQPFAEAEPVPNSSLETTAAPKAEAQVVQ